MKNKTCNRRKLLVVFLAAVVLLLVLAGRLVYLMIFEAGYYQEKAQALHEREREIKAKRGEIVDRNGTVLATNRTVCTISVIHSQVTDPEEVIRALSGELGLPEEEVRKKVEKVSSRERIQANVDKEVGDRIRDMGLDGVKVDEDFKRYYPYGELASKVLGFTGGDNQGIIGLEAKYEEYLKGENGTILTTTDARGIELEGVAEDRVEPVPGHTLQLSLDYNLQTYAQQMAEKVLEEKKAQNMLEGLFAHYMDCPEDMEAADFEETRSFSYEEAAAAINSIPEGDTGPRQIAPQELPEGIQIISRDPAGYVEEIQIGGFVFTGEEIQYALGLSSSCFFAGASEDGLRFTVKGKGHGYGLSQYTANEKAKDGWTADDILGYFYKNIVISE